MRGRGEIRERGKDKEMANGEERKRRAGKQCKEKRDYALEKMELRVSSVEKFKNERKAIGEFSIAIAL